MIPKAFQTPLNPIQNHIGKTDRALKHRKLHAHIKAYYKHKVRTS